MHGRSVELAVRSLVLRYFQDDLGVAKTVVDSLVASLMMLKNVSGT